MWKIYFQLHRITLQLTTISNCYLVAQYTHHNGIKPTKKQCVFFSLFFLHKITPNTQLNSTGQSVLLVAVVLSFSTPLLVTTRQTCDDAHCAKQDEMKTEHHDAEEYNQNRKITTPNMAAIKKGRNKMCEIYAGRDSAKWLYVDDKIHRKCMENRTNKILFENTLRDERVRVTDSGVNTHNNNNKYTSQSKSLRPNWTNNTKRMNTRFALAVQSGARNRFAASIHAHKCALTHQHRTKRAQRTFEYENRETEKYRESERVREPSKQHTKLT